MNDGQLENAKERIRTQFWLKPNGRIVKWKGSVEDVVKISSLHSQIAYDLFPEIKYAGDYLLSQGWIKIGCSCYGHYTKKMPTDKQMQVLAELKIKRITGPNMEYIKIMQL